MKKLLLILLVLSACVSEPYEQPGMEVKVVEKEVIIIQCWDGSVAESLNDCPPRVEAKAPEPDIQPDSVPAQDIVKVEPPTIPIAKKLLADARTRFEGYAYLSICAFDS